MKFAVTVGSHLLAEFIELQILSLRNIFGPDIPILITDDISQRSVEIRDLAAHMDVHHTAGGPRGHFAGDCQTAVDALAFAEDQGADICLKLSQRFVLCEPVAREILERYFSDSNLWLVLPGRIPPGTIKRAESRFFSNLAVQTDVLAIRTGTMRPAELKDLYETRVRTGQNMRHAALIEGLWANLIDTHFATHYVFAPEFTVPYPGREPIYLRKCQSEPADYQQLAERLGMKQENWVPLLIEWRQMSNSYRPCPQFI